MTYFTQNNTTFLSLGIDQLLLIKDQVIENKPTIKILSVTPNQNLKYGEHILGTRDRD